jgi:hypothetical protein
LRNATSDGQLLARLVRTQSAGGCRWLTVLEDRLE